MSIGGAWDTGAGGYPQLNYSYVPTTTTNAWPQPWYPIYPALGPNYCTKCASYYAKPGTCNCYAVYTTYSYWPPTQPYTMTIEGNIFEDNNGEPSGTLTTTHPGDSWTWTWNVLDGGNGTPQE